MFEHSTRGAVAAALVALLCALVLGGCARDASLLKMRLHSPARSDDSAPRTVRVVSANVAPRVPTTGWQPSTNQSILAGALAGGGAGAGVGAGVCTVSIFCPPCYATCVAALGLGGAAVGAFGGRVAHRQFASDPANRMLPALDEMSEHFRSRMVATLSRQPGLRVEDGGAARLGFARDESDSERATADAPTPLDNANAAPAADVLEIALTAIRAEALRKGGFEVQMKARARLRKPTSASSSDVEDFAYHGKALAEGGGIEAEAQRIAADVERGMEAMALEIRDQLVLGK